MPVIRVDSIFDSREIMAPMLEYRCYSLTNPKCPFDFDPGVCSVRELCMTLEGNRHKDLKKVMEHAAYITGAIDGLVEMDLLNKEALDWLKAYTKAKKPGHPNAPDWPIVESEISAKVIYLFPEHNKD